MDGPSTQHVLHLNVALVTLMLRQRPDLRTTEARVAAVATRLAEMFGGAADKYGQDATWVVRKAEEAGTLP
jgi:hypothetical protein